MTRLTLTIALFLTAFSSEAQDAFFEDTDRFLQKYVADGRVDYESLVKNPQELNALYAQVEKIDLAGKSSDFEKAFYINAYNILVISQVVKMYPIKSPLENGKFFNGIKHTVADKKLTLDGLEKETLLKKYPDPRIHFAVVCAAVGCPPIYERAFTPENMDALLSQRTTDAMNNDYFTRVSGKKLGLSQIFNWYKSDFTGKKFGLVDFVNQYRTEKVPENAKVSYYEYDWNLNKK